MRIAEDCDWPGTIVISETTAAAAQVVFGSHQQEFVLEFDPTESKYDGYTIRIVDLLAAAPKLKLKTLRLMWNDGLSGPMGFEPSAYQLGWIFDVPADFAPPLEHLTLGEITLVPRELSQLLSGCWDTLASLSLYDLGLDLAPGWMFQAFSGPGPPVDSTELLWTTFARRVSAYT